MEIGVLIATGATTGTVEANISGIKRIMGMASSATPAATATPAITNRYFLGVH